MGLDAGKILKILYREDIHTAILQETVNSCLKAGKQNLNFLVGGRLAGERNPERRN
jgi:hypothetical protein